MSAIHVEAADDPKAWDAFLLSRRYRPFLQSWTMGEVYRDTGQEPIRLVARENGTVVGLCLAVVVPARRGRHLSIPYGPVIGDVRAAASIFAALRERAAEHRCSFARMSPFVVPEELEKWRTENKNRIVEAPLHLLAEHVWYLPLREPDPWSGAAEGVPVTEDDLLRAMRPTTRNLVRRAERDGIVVTASADPAADVETFIGLHEETRRRHGFTPYTPSFFRAQVKRFAAEDAVTLYVARYKGDVVCSSIHMRFGGETSYHHGASSSAHAKLPGSYALQWRAIRDALARSDRVYSFWGIAPEGARRHPFAGVTLFKTGFGGRLLRLAHCTDLPVSTVYAATYVFETLRKWKRGF